MKWVLLAAHVLLTGLLFAQQGSAWISSKALLFDSSQNTEGIIAEARVIGRKDTALADTMLRYLIRKATERNDLFLSLVKFVRRIEDLFFLIPGQILF